MAVEAFITIHDSALIDACERASTFGQIDHTYLFVGPRPVCHETDAKVIVCRDYVPNYEHLPQFYDFTGWFVLAKNNLVTADTVVMLQYDHRIIVDDFVAQCEAAIQGFPVVAFVPAPYPMWTLGVDGFYDQQMRALSAYGLNWQKMLSERPIELWPSTQGTIWTKQFFVDFMNWFEPCFGFFHKHPFAGHLAERMIQPYLMTQKLNAGYLLGVVQHDSLDCHGTRELSMGNMAEYSAKASTFGR